MSEITLILQSLGRDRAAAADLFPLVYEELRRLAGARMAREAPGHTLQATALVHEAYLRLVDTPEQTWENRAHFFGAAAESMRRILIDHARRRRALRHGGGQRPEPLEDLPIAAPGSDDEMLDLHDALEKLAAHDAEKAELVKLKYFAGLTTAQAADILGVSEATAKRAWAYARAWLFREIQKTRQS